MEQGWGRGKHICSFSLTLDYFDIHFITHPCASVLDTYSEVCKYLDSDTISVLLTLFVLQHNMNINNEHKVNMQTVTFNLRVFTSILGSMQEMPPFQGTKSIGTFGRCIHGSLSSGCVDGCEAEVFDVVDSRNADRADDEEGGEEAALAVCVLALALVHLPPRSSHSSGTRRNTAPRVE